MEVRKVPAMLEEQRLLDEERFEGTECDFASEFLVELFYVFEVHAS